MCSTLGRTYNLGKAVPIIAYRPSLGHQWGSADTSNAFHRCAARAGSTESVLRFNQTDRRALSAERLADLIELLEEARFQVFDDPRSARHHDHVGRAVFEFIFRHYQSLLVSTNDRHIFRKARRRHLHLPDVLNGLAYSGGDGAYRLWSQARFSPVIAREVGSFFTDAGLDMLTIADSCRIDIAFAVRSGINPDLWDRYRMPGFEIVGPRLLAQPVAGLLDKPMGWFGDTASDRLAAFDGLHLAERLSGRETETARALVGEWEGTMGELLHVARSLTAH